MDYRRKRPNLSPKPAIKPTLNQHLATLPMMDRRALQGLWERLFLKPPNPSLRREVLIPILAYRLQEKQFGQLRSSVERKLNKRFSAAKDVRELRLDRMKFVISPTTSRKKSIEVLFLPPSTSLHCIAQHRITNSD
jgi:hypothetical protein